MKLSSLVYLPCTRFDAVHQDRPSESDAPVFSFHGILTKLALHNPHIDWTACKMEERRPVCQLPGLKYKPETINGAFVAQSHSVNLFNVTSHCNNLQEVFGTHPTITLPDRQQICSLVFVHLCSLSTPETLSCLRDIHQKRLKEVYASIHFTSWSKVLLSVERFPLPPPTY